MATETLNVQGRSGEGVSLIVRTPSANLPYSVMRDAVLAHPTMAEGLGPLFSNVLPR